MCQFAAHPCSAQMLDRVAKAALGDFSFTQQGLRPERDPERPVSPARPCLPGEPVHGFLRQIGPSSPCGRLDELGHSPVRDDEFSIISGDTGGRECLFVLPAAVAEHGVGVLTDSDSDSFAARASFANRDLDQVSRFACLAPPGCEDQRAIRRPADPRRLRYQLCLCDQRGSGRELAAEHEHGGAGAQRHPQLAERARLPGDFKMMV